jgi:Flp pilus assembly protein TadG
MFRRTESGQSLVEFALILPVLVLMLVGTLDLGRVVLANDTVSNAAREAARYAIVHGSQAASRCPAGPLPSDVEAPAASTSCPYPSPSKESIKEVARRWAMSGGYPIVVEVCYGDGCSGDTDAVGATNERGTPVTVAVRSTVTMAAGGLIGFDAFGVSASSTMKVNQ